MANASLRIPKVQRSYVLPPHRMTPIQHFYAWSRRYKAATYRTVYVGRDIYTYMASRVRPSAIAEDGGLQWGESLTVYLKATLHPVGVVPGYLQ